MVKRVFGIVNFDYWKFFRDGASVVKRREKSFDGMFIDSSYFVFCVIVSARISNSLLYSVKVPVTSI